MDSSIIITFAIPLFFGLILIEFFYGILKKQNNYRINDAITSMSLGLISRFVPILGLGFQYVVYKAVAEQYNLKLLNGEEIWVWVTAFVLYDVCYYWMHRIHHEIKVFWATHVVHHHGEEFINSFKTDKHRLLMEMGIFPSIVYNWHSSSYVCNCCRYKSSLSVLGSH